MPQVKKVKTPSAPEATAEQAPSIDTVPTVPGSETVTVSTPEPMPSIIEASERVVYNGQNVRAVLFDGRELRDDTGKITHYHCSLEDGSTAHVPVTLFV